MDYSVRARRAAAALSLVGAVTFGLLAAARSSAQNRGWTRLPGHTPSPGLIAARVARVAPQEPIALALTLPLRNQDQLEDLLGRLYDPQDPACGHYLSSADFQSRFTPTEAQYAAVAAYARSQGLAITGTHPN